MRRKGTDHQAWHQVAHSEQTVTALPGGTIVDFRVLEMNTPLIGMLLGQSLTVMDTGYRWISYIPEGTKHALLVMLDTSGSPLQLYVDVAERTGVGEGGLPWIDDLYLDVTANCAVLPDGRWRVMDTEIIDQDELETAMLNGKITQAQFDLAWTEARKIDDALQNNHFEPVEIVRQYLHDPYTWTQFKIPPQPGGSPMTQPTLQAPLPPQAVQAVKAALHAIPMNATVGVTITDVGVGWATGECPDTPAFQNHLGTIHAGAQFLLAEAVSGAAFGGAFAAHFASAVPLIERLDTHYVGRARGGLTARAEARAAELPAALEAYKTEGKARLVIDVSVRDGDNKEVMRAVAHWYLRSMATLRSK